MPLDSNAKRKNPYFHARLLPQINMRAPLRASVLAMSPRTKKPDPKRKNLASEEGDEKLV